MSKKIIVKNLYKIFGDAPESMMEAVNNGIGKEKLLSEHNHVLGLNDVSFSVNQGEIFVFMGLSGSGKSTLIRHINRLIDPTSGEVLIDGENILEYKLQQIQQLRQTKISMVFQKFALMPHMTILDNVAYGLTVQKKKKEFAHEQAQHWINRVGLSGFEKQHPSQLSGGMQQRVGLARALATDSEVILMDEAFSALDPLIRTEMQDLLLELQQELHKTIVFITHDLEEAVKLGDQISILKDGSAVQQGTPEDIILRPADAYIENFTENINPFQALNASTAMTPLTPHLSVKKEGKNYTSLIDKSSRIRNMVEILKKDEKAIVGVTDGDAIIGEVRLKNILDVV
jgi:glycine betaine/proline transport system ATP-binding protein